MTQINLRPWQAHATRKAIHWLVEAKGDKRFLINAAPGAGKTICASVIAQRLIELHEINRVIVIAPRSEVVRQWAARRVEREMSPVARKESEKPATKVCPTCAAQNPRDATACEECGHEFPPRQKSFKTCEECGGLNPMGSERCQSCGHSFRTEFEITLNEALRVGAIVRGMDLGEEEVRDGEQNKTEILADVLASGDDALIKVIKQLPEESWGRLRNILNRK